MSQTSGGVGVKKLPSILKPHLDPNYQPDAKNHQYKCKMAKLVPERIFPVSDYSCGAQPG